MRRKRELSLLFALITGLLDEEARAVVVLPKGTDKPVMGYLVRQDERTVMLRQIDSAGKSREQSFAKSDIDELILTVLPERLAVLDPAKPEMYREYAEELAEKQRDPEARDAAIRLYIICAAHADGPLRHSALLGLIVLARSPQEEKRFRAAAYLYDPRHDVAVLTATGPAAGRSLPGEAADDAELAKALRLIRQGKGAAARPLLERPAVQAAAARLTAILQLDDLQSAAAAKLLTDQQLKKLVQAELALEPRGPDEATVASVAISAVPVKWSQARKSGGLAPLPGLSLDQLTEFNPAECVFRDGKWVRP